MEGDLLVPSHQVLQQLLVIHFLRELLHALVYEHGAVLHGGVHHDEVLVSLVVAQIATNHLRSHHSHVRLRQRQPQRHELLHVLEGVRPRCGDVDHRVVVEGGEHYLSYPPHSVTILFIRAGRHIRYHPHHNVQTTLFLTRPPHPNKQVPQSNIIATTFLVLRHLVLVVALHSLLVEIVQLHAHFDARRVDHCHAQLRRRERTLVLGNGGGEWGPKPLKARGFDDDPDELEDVGACRRRHFVGETAHHEPVEELEDGGRRERIGGRRQLEGRKEGRAGGKEGKAEHPGTAARESTMEEGRRTHWRRDRRRERETVLRLAC